MTNSINIKYQRLLCEHIIVTTKVHLWVELHALHSIDQGTFKYNKSYPVLNDKLHNYNYTKFRLKWNKRKNVNELYTSDVLTETK